eukprot:1386717-Pyramimonas_sp.AAC.1
MLRTSDDILDRSLAESGYAQNNQAQVACFVIAGLGAAACKKHVREHGVAGGRMEGVVSDVARFLGPVLTPTQQSTLELERRLAAATSAYCSMGRFWSLRLPRAWRRAIFQGL